MSEHAEPIVLNERTVAIINGATMRGMPLAVAYVDAQGHPNLSPRGTVQVAGPDQLALWARTRGLPDALAVNANVALLYQDLAHHDVLLITGRGRAIADAEFRNRVFDGSPPSEQAHDPERTGTAILIELDSVRGRTGDELVTMARASVHRR